MNEVSCKALAFVLPVLEARRIPRDRLLGGLGLSPAELDDPARRIDWDTHAEILERFDRLCGPALHQLGPTLIEAAPLRVLRALGCFVASPARLYRAGVCWIGPSLFSNVRWDFRELDGGRLQVELSLPEGFRGSLPFFAITEGILRATPRLLGLRQEAEVESEISPHRGRYTIRPPRPNRLLAILRRVLRGPLAAHTALDELVAQQEDASRILETIGAPRRREAASPGEIETIGDLGLELAQQTESAELPDRILGLLRDRFGWRGASLQLRSPKDDALVFFGRAGAVAGDADWSRPLLLGDRSVGRLDVWQGERPVNGPLVEKLLPWVTLSVLNAHLSAAWSADEPAPGFRWASKGVEDLFLILDGGARILYAGPSSDRLLGYERDELMRMDLAQIVHPDDLARLVDEFGELARHTSSALYYAARARHHDGSWRQLEGVAIKVLSEGGADVYLISSADRGDRSAQH